MTYHQLPTKYINQVSLNVSDLNRSIEYYQNILGLKLLDIRKQQATLSFDGQSSILVLIEPEEVKPLDRTKTGLFHVAYLVPSRADLADVVYYLWKNQIPIQGASDHGVSEALYLADPDGNGIEIYRDRPPEEWKWDGNHVQMETKSLDVQGLLKEKTEEGWQGFPQETVIGHIHLQANELKHSQEFYKKLGFEVVAQYGPQALFMSDKQYHHHIGLNTWNSTDGEKKLGDEVGLNWFYIDMTEEDREKIKNKVNASNDGDSYFIEDPSGIKIKF